MVVLLVVAEAEVRMLGMALGRGTEHFQGSDAERVWASSPRESAFSRGKVLVPLCLWAPVLRMRDQKWIH